MSRPHIEGNIFRGRLPHGKNFPQAIPQLIQQLAAVMTVPLTELDYSFQSLRMIDRFAFKQLGRYQCLEPYVFEPLVAYCGEIVRQRSGGRWEMRLAANEPTWEPWIVAPDGTLDCPGGRVFEALWELDSPESIASLIW